MSTYRYLGRKITLEADEDLVAVRFKEPARYSTRTLEATTAGGGEFANRIELEGEKYTVLPVAAVAESRGKRYAAFKGKLQASKDVARVSPVFRSGDSLIVGTDRVIARLKDIGKDRTAVAKSVHGRIVGTVGPDSIIIALRADADPFEASEVLSKDRRVMSAAPDFVMLAPGEGAPARLGVESLAATAPPHAEGAAGDPLEARQYAMRLIGASEAWKIQRGRREIAIAILDSGVDTRHEDLSSAIGLSFDAIDNDSFQEPNLWDGHGTSVAGLAGAIANNALGLRGVAGGCTLMPARFAFRRQSNAAWQWSVSAVANSIYWASQKGASVINFSWFFPSHPNLTLAVSEAVTRGRNGRGCVFVAAAGNARSRRVDYPAALPNVIAVSASDERDRFIDVAEPGGWGSNFGPEISIAAPGIRHVTTAISRQGPQGSNYRDDFYGTSSSAPLVAGAAALMLSANPMLTARQVADILRATADKVGHVGYHNGRNDYFGHGRLNVLRAVQAARQPVPIA